MFVQVTRKGGQSMLLNADNVAAIRDRAGDNLAVVAMVDGSDFEVQERFDDLVAKMSGEPGPAVQMPETSEPMRPKGV